MQNSCSCLSGLIFTADLFAGLFLEDRKKYPLNLKNNNGFRFVASISFRTLVLIDDNAWRDMKSPSWTVLDSDYHKKDVLKCDIIILLGKFFIIFETISNTRWSVSFDINIRLNSTRQKKAKNKIRLAPYNPFLIACFDCAASFVFHLIKRSKQDEGRTWRSRFSKSSKLNKSLGSYSELHMLTMAVIWNECKLGHVLYRIWQALGLYRRTIQLRLL